MSELSQTINATFADLLQSTALAHIATLGPDGAPQSSPVWFDWDGEFLLFSQTKDRQKYKNVRRDARIAFSIVDPQNPYRYLEIRGRVARIDEDPDKAFINKMSAKYTGDPNYAFDKPGAQRVVIVIQPEHITHM